MLRYTIPYLPNKEEILKRLKWTKFNNDDNNNNNKSLNRVSRSSIGSLSIHEHHSVPNREKIRLASPGHLSSYPLIHRRPSQ